MAKPKTGRTARAAAKGRTPKAGAKKKVVLLSGGNPQIAKADGDAPVQAYIAALPGWKRELGKRLDALIVRSVPGVRKAVKWNSPFYGVEGQGWFLALRYADLHEGELDEAQMASWVKQAAALPGWIP